MPVKLPSYSHTNSVSRYDDITSALIYMLLNAGPTVVVFGQIYHDAARTGIRLLFLMSGE